MNRTWKGLAWTAGAAALLFGGWKVWHREKPRPENTPVEEVRTATAHRGTLQQVVRETGRLQPATQIEVKSEVGGRVAEILVDTGETVKAGQLLVRLDDRILKTQREQALLKVEQARLTEESKQRVSERKRRMAAGSPGLIPVEELEQARTDADLAVVSRRDAEQAVRNVEEQLAHTAIASSMDGRVIERAVGVGDVVVGTSTAGTPTTLMTVADTRRMQVVVEVHEVDAPKVAVGQAVEVRASPLPERTFHGKVAAVGLSGHADAKNRNVVTYTVQALLEDPEGLLRAGMTAAVDIVTTRRENALLLPREAVTSREGKPWALRMKDSKGERVALTTGLEGETEVEILSGLSEGDVVRLGGFDEEDWQDFHQGQEDRRKGSSSRRRGRGRM